MRLLQYSKPREFSLAKGLAGEDTILSYAILSYTWEVDQRVAF